MMAEVRRRRKKSSDAADVVARIDENIRKGLVPPGERQLGIDAYAANARGTTYGKYMAAKQAERMQRK